MLIRDVVVGSIIEVTFGISTSAAETLDHFRARCNTIGSMLILAPGTTQQVMGRKVQATAKTDRPWYFAGPSSCGCDYQFGL